MWRKPRRKQNTGLLAILSGLLPQRTPRSQWNVDKRLFLSLMIGKLLECSQRIASRNKILLFPCLPTELWKPWLLASPHGSSSPLPMAPRLMTCDARTVLKAEAQWAHLWCHLHVTSPSMNITAKTLRDSFLRQGQWHGIEVRIKYDST